MARPVVAAAIVALAAAYAGCSSTSPLEGLGTQTFSASAEDVHAAAKAALDALTVAVDRDQKTDTGRWIYAHTPERSVNVQVVAVAPGSTRLSVIANAPSGAQDPVTAGEIISQTTRALEARLAAKPARSTEKMRQPVERK